MAVRATKKLDYATIMTYTVASGLTATKGKVVKRAAADNQVQDAPPGDDNLLGVVIDITATGTADLKTRVQVAIPGGTGSVPMLVGTGGVTQGKKVVVVATGVQDAPTQVVPGSAAAVIVGIAMDSGVAGDFAGVNLDFSNRAS